LACEAGRRVDQLDWPGDKTYDRGAIAIADCPLCHEGSIVVRDLLGGNVDAHCALCPARGDVVAEQLVLIAEQRQNGVPEGGVGDVQAARPTEAGKEALRPTFAVERWSAFRDRTPEELEMLVDGLLVKAGLFWLGAPAKGMKTWLALLLAICKAAGARSSAMTLGKPRTCSTSLLKGSRPYPRRWQHNGGKAARA
jgi:hypothetical protein